MRAKVHITKFINDNREEDEFTGEFLPDTHNQEFNIVNLYPQVTFQTVEGFGGAITEAVGVTLNHMSAEKQQEIMNLYFSPEGIGYGMVRTHIDSCDFSLSNYSADSNPEDVSFETFSLERDEETIIPFIKMANNAAGKTLPVMLTPWSPPAFMKTNGSRNGGGKLKKECYSAWALYICHYIQKYRGYGLDVSSISVQNEPNASQEWDSCVFSDNEEKEFLEKYLYPALQQHGMSDLEVYIWDHNKERMFDRAVNIIDDETSNMIAGVAFHWYTGDHFEALELVHGRYPDKKLLFSEGCIEYSRFGVNNQLQNAQMYAHDMIGNFKSGMNIFIDWNILLDQQGGPNHACNFCEAPIICDTRTGEYQKKLSFYYIEHFSRYIKPGAVRIATTQFTERIELVAFKNPDATLAVIILSRQTDDVEIYLRIDEKLLKFVVPKESMITVTTESVG